MPTQKEIATKCGITDAHLSQVLSGSANVGPKAAKGFEVLTGRQWTEFLTMNPKQIREALGLAQ